MNQTFNFDRFLHVWHQQWHTSGKKYLMTLGMVLGIILVLVAWILIFSYSTIIENLYDWDPMHATMNIMFYLGLAIYGCLSASQVFKAMSDKLTAINSLMLPASQLEKYLARWIMCLPVAFVLYCVGFEIINLLRCFWLSITLHPFSVSHAFDFLDALSDLGIWTVLACFVGAQSFFVLGSILWPKRPVVITFGVLFALQWVFGLIATAVLYIRMPDGAWSLFTNEDESTVTCLLAIIVSGVVALFNYTLAYFRYREAEIINRW